MPRDIPIGNGNLLITFDGEYNLRDLYYPYVGEENQTAGGPNRFGIWAGGQFAWLSDPGWRRSLGYERDTLVTLVQAYHPGLAIALECRDAVDVHRNLYLRQVTINNASGERRELRLFFHLDCHLMGQPIGNTAYYDPRHRALVHYKGRRFIWLGGYHGGQHGLSSFATGNKGFQGAEGTWRDAEDGELGRNVIAQGSVDSVGALHLTLEPDEVTQAIFWLGLGETYDAVRALDQVVRERGPESFLDRTRNFWQLWARKDRRFADLPGSLIDLYKRSLLIIRTQIDERGAILAANDSDILQFGRDTYSYMWPRDGALVVKALIYSSHGNTARRFFEFCAQTIMDSGYFLHKYNPDGSVGSSWHPWSTGDGQYQLPIQEDETALVLCSLLDFWERFNDVEYTNHMYRTFARRAADFLVRYRDPETGLPLPSYDLWEERRGVYGFTVGAVWGGLEAVARLAETFGEPEVAAHYRQIAEEIRSAALAHLYDPARGRFLRGLTAGSNAALEPDPTIDSSLAGLWLFGMLPPNHPAVRGTMAAIADRLWVKTSVGGVARYENDSYFRVRDDTDQVAGNPWIICTLWLAQWQIASAHTLADLDQPRQLLSWVEERALSSGVLPEQLHPDSGAPLSVSPLTWSHASFVLAVQDYVVRYRQLRGWQETWDQMV